MTPKRHIHNPKGCVVQSEENLHMGFRDLLRRAGAKLTLRSLRQVDVLHTIAFTKSERSTFSTRRSKVVFRNSERIDMLF